MFAAIKTGKLEVVQRITDSDVDVDINECDTHEVGRLAEFFSVFVEDESRQKK